MTRQLRKFTQNKRVTFHFIIIFAAFLFLICINSACSPKISDAKTAISAAMNPKAGDARIYYHAGMIEKDLGNRAEAKKMLEAALKLNPMFDLIQAENARKALSELK